MAQEVIITQGQLCRAMKNSEAPFTDCSGQLKNLQEFVLTQLNIEEPDLDSLSELEIKLKTFLSHVIKRYKKSSRKFEDFMSSASNQNFFSHPLVIPNGLLAAPESDGNSPVKSSKQQKIGKAGRHSLPFDQKSIRGQQLASAEVRQHHEPGAINLAASQQKTPLGRLIQKTKSPSGTTAKLVLSGIEKNPNKCIIKKSPEEALGFLLVNHLTKTQYKNLKTACSQSQADLWPNYSKVVEAKSLCRPSDIDYQELSVSVNLQSLLNHTVSRIMEKNPVITELSQKNQNLNLVCYFKFGFDGCGSFSTFNQKNSLGHVPDGCSLLVSQLVPLSIILKDYPDIIVYRNSSPNSANSCRPIRLAYERESKENIRGEASRLKTEVDSLQPFVFSQFPKVTVEFKGLFTLVDGKVLLELTNCSASSSCPICHKTYREISNPEGEFIPKEGSLDYGASILHFGLRAFECLCHIGYKQDIKKSRVVLTQEEKDSEKRREKDVKAQFLSKLGLVVDQRRDGGAGNTTTGNVVRKAFKNSSVTAEICGVPKKLVENFSTIWGALSCGFDLDPEKFASFCEETEKIYFDKEFGVGWYSLPPTLHKIFKHGADIIKACPVPIGLTSEEASEANNKFLRRFRLHHSRKISWQDGIKDLFNRLLDISDPIIQESMHASKTRKSAKNPLSPQILSLLRTPENPQASFDAIFDASSDESDSE